MGWEGVWHFLLDLLDNIIRYVAQLCKGGLLQFSGRVLGIFRGGGEPGFSCFLATGFDNLAT